jgi:hypothetical protein
MRLETARQTIRFPSGIVARFQIRLGDRHTLSGKILQASDLVPPRGKNPGILKMDAWNGFADAEGGAGHARLVYARNSNFHCTGEPSGVRRHLRL